MDSKNKQKELARAHIVIQQLHKIWDPEKGLMKGTIFPELYRPYCPPKEHDDKRETFVTYEDQNAADYYQYCEYCGYHKDEKWRGGRRYERR